MRALSFVTSLAVVSVATVASADPPSFDARTWRPSTDPSAGLVLESTTTPGAWAWNVGAWSDYALHPVTLSGTGGAGGMGGSIVPVAHALDLDLVASLGLGARASVGVDLPLAVYQTGDRPLPSSVARNGETPSSAIGDVGLHGKVSLVDASNGGFGLAALATITLPTGDPASFLGEGSPTASARLLAEYTLLVASVQASLGYAMRTSTTTWPDPGGIELGDSIPWTFGVSLRPDVFKLDPSHRQRWDLALHGSIPVTPVGPFGAGDPGSALLTPVAVSLGDRIELGHYRDAFAVVGIELGLTDAIGLPSFRGVLAVGWAPRDHDLDHDGVPDDVDQCPELPEDRDGFEDQDGCPELDNDDDGVLDKDDACPNVAGIASDDPKKNGCPQPDRDHDGVADSVDACPDEKGLESDDRRTNGCPTKRDRDKDGIPDANDRCPDQPEDKDGFQDDDGCPDPDDDGDGIADAQDACPREPGDPSTDATKNGCPNPDRDGDTYDNAVDKCPDEPETFNGVADDDGCPDTGGKALVTVTPAKNAPPALVIAAGDPLKIDGTTLRAIALEAHAHPDWTLLVAVAGKSEPSLARAGVIADALDRLAHRELAEAAAWTAVSKSPATTRDAKLVVVVGGQKEREPTLPPVKP